MLHHSVISAVSRSVTCNTLVALLLLFKLRAQNMHELLMREESWRKKLCCSFRKIFRNIFRYPFRWFSHCFCEICLLGLDFPIYNLQRKTKKYIGSAKYCYILSNYFSNTSLNFFKLLFLVLESIHQFFETRTTLIILWFQSNKSDIFRKSFYHYLNAFIISSLMYYKLKSILFN